MNLWTPKSAWGKALLLAFVYAYGWFVLQCVTQWILWRGHTTVGEYDWGLLTIVPGWILALLWGWPVCSGLSRDIIGRPSDWGYLAAILSVPASFILLYLRLGPFFHFSFFSLSLFGLLPEGRGQFGFLHAAGFFSALIVGFLGFYKTASDATKKSIGAFAVLFALMLSSISAYDIPTHKTFLTNEAAALLHTTHNGTYDEIFSRRFDMEIGTENEDASGPVSEDPFSIFRFLSHFYRPTDGKALGIFDNARQRLIDEGFFRNAITKYQQGNKTDAYKLLGHALHLATQDMLSPPHTHLDIHFDPGLIGFAPNGYESWVKGNFNRIATDPRRSGAFIPPLIDPPEDTLASLARLTYMASRIPGELNRTGPPASGILAQMFPAMVRIEPIPPLAETVWFIPGAGDCREFSGAIGNPGPFDNWWKAQNFSGESGDFFYIENSGSAFPAVYKDGSPTGGKSLAELWALEEERLLAKSQEFSAGLMKQFAGKGG